VVTFNAAATDSDLPGQTLTYSLDASTPAGASINATTGAFAWTTTEANGPGNYTVTVRVRDNGSPVREDFETLQITVSEVNQPPVLNAIGQRYVVAGTQLAFTATATDADLPFQALTFTLGPGAPIGATITAGGAFSWTPAVGYTPITNQITVRVTDTASGSDTETFNVLVLTGPRLLTPTWESNGNLRITWESIAGKRYQVSYTSALGTSWTNLGNAVTASQATTFVLDSTPTPRQRFYRVQQLN
jgi:hypothetical protein